MLNINYFFSQLLGPTFFWQWRSLIEIVFFSYLFYFITNWLKKDTSKNLLPYFYGYCLIAFCSYNLQLTTINYALFVFAPAGLCLFILAHQDTLQRNFVALKNITPLPKQSNNWIELLFRSLLQAVSLQKKIIVLIECTDSLDPFLHTPFALNAPLTYDLLMLLTHSPSYDLDSYIWINKQGIIRGINSAWKKPFALKSTLATKADDWISNALVYTSKTDACMFLIDPDTSRCTIIHGGQQQKNIQTNHAMQIIMMLTKQKKEMVYETNKKNHAQRTP